jgi:hypothetical protein
MRLPESHRRNTPKGSERPRVVTFVHTPVKIRIRKVPPSTFLEGYDLRPYDFRAGYVYELDRRLGEVLIVWGYAEPEMRSKDRDQAADKKHE